MRGAVIVLLVLLLCSAVGAIDEIEIEFTSDTTFLPYRMVVLDSFVNGDGARPAGQLIRPLVPGIEDSLRALFTQIHLPPEDEDRAFTVDFNRYPPNQFQRQAAIWIEFRQWQAYYDSASGFMSVVVTGYQRDSAWVYEVDPRTSEYRSQFLMSESDDRGDGTWQPYVDIKYIGDFDRDGTVEVLIHVNPEREAGVRTLFCLELGTLGIEWSLPMASGPISVLPLADGSLMMTLRGPYQGKRDANFDDRLGYLVIVDSTGQLRLNQVIKSEVCSVWLKSAPDGRSYYFIHEFPPVDADSARVLLDEGRISEVQDGQFRLSQITSTGKVIRSVSFANPAAHFSWIPYGSRGEPHLFVTHDDGSAEVYDTTLAVVARAEKSSAKVFADVWRLSGGTEVMAAYDGLYTTEFRQLAAFDGRTGTLSPLLYDTLGNVTTFILASSQEGAMVRFEKRGWVDIATIFYFRYRSYILVLITALVVGLVLVNYYRQRTRRNLVVIREQKEKLERAQRELKEAQAKLVAQEKFRQARDIAGGFAHEIRNALSPARHALGKMMSLGRNKLSEDKLERMGGLVDRSLAHAVELTERISEYSHVEDMGTSREVDLGELIDKVLAEHRHLVEAAGVEVIREGATEARRGGNPRHFELVVANLVRNAITAMEGCEVRRLRVGLEAYAGEVVMVVSDTGRGMDEVTLERIWDIFYTTDPDRGTGVGLTLVRKIVDVYGGTISVSSAPGEGTTFRVGLPR